MEASPKVGLQALLTPDNCVLVLIDHQPFQLANVNSHEPTMVINNVTALAKTAKAFNIPTILTTVNEARGGLIFKTVQDVFPNQTTINRTFINAWEDKRVVDAVKDTGRKKLVIAALWSEMCLAMPGTGQGGRALGTLRCPHPKATLVDFQRPNLPFERRPRDPESGRRSRGAEHTSAARAQRIFDDRLLVAATAPDKPSRLSTGCAVDNQLSSTANSSVSETMTDRSMTFCSSRTFPGHR